MRRSMNSASIVFLWLAAAMYFISGCDGRPESGEDKDSLHSGKTEDETTAPPPLMKSGVVVAIFVVALCFAIFMGCLLYWLIGKCRYRQRNRAWIDVFESKHPFPVRRTRVIKDNEDQSAWKGPPPHERTLYNVPSYFGPVGTESVSLSNETASAPDDPSTNLEPPPIDEKASSNSGVDASMHSKTPDKSPFRPSRKEGRVKEKKWTDDFFS